MPLNFRDQGGVAPQAEASFLIYTLMGNPDGWSRHISPGVMGIEGLFLECGLLLKPAQEFIS